MEHKLSPAEDCIIIDEVAYRRDSLLGSGKSADSYLFRRITPGGATRDDASRLSQAEPAATQGRTRPNGRGGASTDDSSPHSYVLPELITMKRFVDRAENYIPLDAAIEREVAAYSTLQQIGIPTPRLIMADRDALSLVKEYVHGQPVIEAVGAGTLPDWVWPEVFAMCATARCSGWNLDWFPANFLLTPSPAADRGVALVYVDYEVNPWEAEWSWEEWGIFYWLNSAGVSTFLQTGDGDAINVPGTFKPYRTPGRVMRRDTLCRTYAPPGERRRDSP